MTFWSKPIEPLKPEAPDRTQCLKERKDARWQNALLHLILMTAAGVWIYWWAAQRGLSILEVFTFHLPFEYTFDSLRWPLFLFLFSFLMLCSNRYSTPERYFKRATEIYTHELAKYEDELTEYRKRLREWKRHEKMEARRLENLPETPETKRCLSCREQINYFARRCPHCTSYQ